MKTDSAQSVPFHRAQMIKRHTIVYCYEIYEQPNNFFYWILCWEMKIINDDGSSWKEI